MNEGLKYDVLFAEIQWKGAEFGNLTTLQVKPSNQTVIAAIIYLFIFPFFFFFSFFFNAKKKICAETDF